MRVDVPCVGARRTDLARLATPKGGHAKVEGRNGVSHIIAVIFALAVTVSDPISVAITDSDGQSHGEPNRCTFRASNISAIKPPNANSDCAPNERTGSRTYAISIAFADHASDAATFIGTKCSSV